MGPKSQIKMKLFWAMRNVSGSRREHREVIYLRKRPFCIEDPWSWYQSWEAEIPQFPSVPPKPGILL